MSCDCLEVTELLRETRECLEAASLSIAACVGYCANELWWCKREEDESSETERVETGASLLDFALQSRRNHLLPFWSRDLVLKCINRNALLRLCNPPSYRTNAPYKLIVISPCYFCNILARPFQPKVGDRHTTKTRSRNLPNWDGMFFLIDIITCLGVFQRRGGVCML